MTHVDPARVDPDRDHDDGGPVAPVDVLEPAPVDGGTDAPPDAPARSAGLGYQPALDGLRGLALLAIILYHAELPGASGAFLSVSTFFTLSGFLITSIMLGELGRTGRLSLGSFWARRSRRLLPAALVAIAAILATGVVLADATQAQRLAGDGLAALLYVANWRFIFSGQSYGAIFQSPSPFTHFWTLSIEEQFYLLFPIVVAVTAWLTKGSRRALATVLGTLAAASVLWSAWLLHRGASIDRLYFGTDTRLAELLAGGLLAVWWVGRTRRSNGRPAPERVQGALVAGTLGLALMVVLWVVANQQEPFFYRGGLALYSLVTLVVIVAALQARGPVRRVLGWAPIVWVGTVSYSAYLLHFPILMWLDLKLGFKPWLRFAVGLPLTLLLAGLFTRAVERPIRTSRRLAGRRGAWAVPVAVTVVLALVVVAAKVQPDGTTTIDFADVQQRMDQLSGQAPSAPVDPADMTPQQRAYVDAMHKKQAQLDASTAPGVAFFGDSTALMTGVGVTDWAWAGDLKDLSPRSGWAELGCGLLTGVVRMAKGQKQGTKSECDHYLDGWRDATVNSRIDIAVVQTGPWDVLDQQIPPSDTFLALGRDPEMDGMIEAHLRDAVDVLRQRTRTVVLVSPPNITVGMVDGRAPTDGFPESDPARMARLREIIARVAASTPHVQVADLSGWLASLPDGGAHLRPDGIHFTDATTPEVARWLGPELVRLYHQDGY